MKYRGLVSVSKSDLPHAAREMIKEKLTVVPVSTSSFNPMPDPIRLWAEDEQHLCVPRGYYNKIVRKRFPDAKAVLQYSVGSNQPRPADPIAPREGQEDVISRAIAAMKENEFGGAIIEATMGCHAKGTEILMFDGSVRRVEDVRVGDQLMGPDSKPRTVLELKRGRQRMVRIAPTKGDPFVVNESHILSLMRTKKRSYPRGSKSPRKDYLGDNPIVNISVADYLSRSKSFKSVHKLYRVPVEFQKKELPIPPYILGLWLGDGTAARAELTSMDRELIFDWNRYIYSIGMSSVEMELPNNRAVTVKAVGCKKGSNAFLSKLRRLNVTRFKHIPSVYLTSSREDRLGLLAGIVDTGGSLSNGTFDYISKDRRLASGVVFLARSLGFAAYMKACQKRDQHGNGGTYYRVCISGELADVPVRLARKRARKRVQKKSVLRTAFDVERLPEDDFYGFSLDGDHLYVMGDFTVTHNSGKTVLALETARRMGMKTLIVVHTTVLMEQWIKEIKRFFPNWSLGIIQGSTVDVKGNDICIGMLHSLSMKDDYPESIYDEFGLIACDEVHYVGATEFQKVLFKFRPKYFLGLSGTLERKDRAENVFKYGIGTIVKAMGDIKVLEPTVYFVDTKYIWAGEGDLDRQKNPFLKSVTNNPVRNVVIINNAVKAALSGRHVLVMSERVMHVEILFKELTKQLKPHGIVVGMMHGKIGKKERAIAEKAQVLVATTQLLAVGFNNDRLDTMVMASPIQGTLYQAVGRILRVRPDKKPPLVVDLVDSGCRMAMVYARSRKKKYGAKNWKTVSPPGFRW
jgi:hypothetical protein